MLAVLTRWRAWRTVRWNAHAARTHAQRSTALIDAVTAQEVDLAQRLLLEGADPNGRHGQRPLVLAVLDAFQNAADWDDHRPGARGNQLLDALLQAGAHPDARPQPASPFEVAGTGEPWVRSGLFDYDHPLHQAVSDGFRGAVVRLLRHGANPQALVRLQGEACLGPVLHQARDAAMARALLEGGANVLATDEWGETALKRARRTLPDAFALHQILERAELRCTVTHEGDDDPVDAPASRRRL